MITDTPLEAAAARGLEFVHEKRLVQGAWHKHEGPPGDRGRDLACGLGAMHPDINSASDCPGDWFPQWFAELTVTLFDGVAATELYPLMERYYTLLPGVKNITPARWDYVRRMFLHRAVSGALEAARPKEGEPVPAYWPAVQSACGDVLALLLLDDAPKDRLQAARAAAEAAEAAGAAWAAWDAARAAEAAAGAAAGAAAQAATYLRLFTHLLDLIEAETGAPS